MPLDDLSEADRGIALACVRFVADGPLFDDSEFETLFGLTRRQVRGVADAWPPVDDADPTVNTAITNAFVNLLGYPHDSDALLAKVVGADRDAIERVFHSWRSAG